MRIPTLPLLALLLLAPPALAENAAPTPAPAAPTAPAIERPKPPAGPHAGFERQPRSPLAGDFADFTAGKIAFLRAELKITAAQEPSFASFVDILKRYSEGMKQHRQTLQEQRRGMASENQLNLPTRLGLRIGGMEQDVQALKILQRALAEFYAVLTDEQKKASDQLLSHLAR